jgi:hypothetical protein
LPSEDYQHKVAQQTGRLTATKDEKEGMWHENSNGSNLENGS